MASYDKLINVSLLSRFLDKAKEIFADKSLATDLNAGLMSADDKTKVDAISLSIVGMEYEEVN